jgi:hypothetical protein
MKTRHGFVSNSSTSSFFIYGASIDVGNSTYSNILRKVREKFSEEYDTYFTDIIGKYEAKESLSDYQKKTLKQCKILLRGDSKPEPKRTCNHDIDTTKPFCPECGRSVWEEAKEESWEALVDNMEEYEFYEMIASIMGLSHNSGGEYSAWNYLGRSWSSIGDDETGKQFRDSVQNKISLVFPELKCSSIQEAWYDG